MKKEKNWPVIAAEIMVWGLCVWFGHGITKAHYKPLLARTQGELAITQSQLAQAKSELATFQGILKTLVEGENPEGMRSPR